jgi:hypothetical protein
VGLALAMEVVNEGRHHKTSHSTDTGDAGGGGGGDALITTTLVREELLFYVAGIVVLTLVINGTLIGHFYHFLNPYPESAHETELRRLGILTTAESVEHTCSRPEWVGRRKKKKSDEGLHVFSFVCCLLFLFFFLLLFVAILRW